jgi:hypothetical protein
VFSALCFQRPRLKRTRVCAELTSKPSFRRMEEDRAREGEVGCSGSQGFVPRQELPSWLVLFLVRRPRIAEIERSCNVVKEFLSDVGILQRDVLREVERQGV